VPAWGARAQLREDLRVGVHVEGLTEEPIACAADAMRVLAAGAGRRQARGWWSHTRACIPGNVPHEGV